MNNVSVYEEQIEKKRKSGIPRLMEIAGTKSVYLYIAVFLSIIAVIAQMTPFITVYLLVKELIVHINTIQAIESGYVWKLGWITLAGVGAFGVFTYAGSMVAHVAAFNILYEIRIALAAKLARLPMGYFTSRNNGSIKKILNEDVERIELFVAHHIIDLVQSAVLPIVSVAVLFYIDWRLAVGVIIPLPLAMGAQMSMFTKTGQELYAQWQERLAAMNGTIVEFVRGMPVIKIFNQSVSAFKRFSDDVYAYRDLTLYWIKTTSTRFSAFLTLLSSSAVFILPVAIFIISTDQSPDGYANVVSTLFLFLYVGMGISVPLYKLMRLSGLIMMINTGIAGIDDILQAGEIENSSLSLQPERYDIEFRNVSFAYGDMNVLDTISFSVPAGTVTALVGPSGGGKSTIANLIGRFWDVRSGDIRIGGVNIRDIPVETLNDTVSTVFQDVFLFFDTIEENIRMGNDAASFDDVVAAAKAAQIHDFIETLPEGYKTLIGEGGTHLSGGEQQRISIARAILKDSPVVVLDEATAYSDPENEARIQKALSVVLKNKTVVIIAHRLYTVTDVDQILVINEGKIVERGTHPELVERNGLYGSLWDIHIKAREWQIAAEKELAL